MLANPNVTPLSAGLHYTCSRTDFSAHPTMGQSFPDRFNILTIFFSLGSADFSTQDFSAFFCLSPNSGQATLKLNIQYHIYPTLKIESQRPEIK